VCDKPNSSSLQVRDQVADLVCDLDSVMECGLYSALNSKSINIKCRFLNYAVAVASTCHQHWGHRL